jgi:hypothetical protein
LDAGNTVARFDAAQRDVAQLLSANATLGDDLRQSLAANAATVAANVAKLDERIAQLQARVK